MPDDKLTLRYIPLSQAQRWDANPKLHDLDALAISIETHGFGDPPKYDAKLDALVYGNGRTEALERMRQDGQEPPRGIAVAEDGEWVVPVIFGVDAESRDAAVAFAIDHNNLTLKGGNLDLADVLAIWDEEGLQQILADAPDAGDMLASLDADAWPLCSMARTSIPCLKMISPGSTRRREEVGDMPRVRSRFRSLSETAMPTPTLKLDWCSQQAAKHAVMRWHYSRAMPAAKLVRVGAWEQGRFVGVVLYGSGANRHLSRPFGLKPIEACELVRVALAPGRIHPTSKVLAISLRMLRKQSPGLQLIVSYADSKEGHLGTIYQATNWLFLGATTQPWLKIRGEMVHPRTVYERYGRGGQRIGWLRENVDPRAERVKMPAKLKYVWPYDKELRSQLAEVEQPYPKRVGSSEVSTVGCARAARASAAPIATSTWRSRRPSARPRCAPSPSSRSTWTTIGRRR